ncbi:MAG: hypothetical protein Q9165_005019 [Trypethelium subeluteriae]
MGFDFVGVLTGVPFQLSSGGPWLCQTDSTEVESAFTTDHGTSTYEAYTTLNYPNNPNVPVQYGINSAAFTFELNPEYPLMDVNVSQWEGDDFDTVPSGLIDFMASIPSITKVWPYMTNCFPGGFEGQPTVHIPVNELTNTQSSTITVAGNAPGSGRLPTPQPAPIPPPQPPAPMPAPVNQPTPAPSPEPVNAPTPGNPAPPANSPAPGNPGSNGGGSSGGGNPGSGSTTGNGNGNGSGVGGSSGSGGSGSSGSGAGNSPGNSGSSSGNNGNAGSSSGSGSGGSNNNEGSNGLGLGGVGSIISAIGGAASQGASPAQGSAAPAPGNFGSGSGSGSGSLSSGQSSSGSGSGSGSRTGNGGPGSPGSSNPGSGAGAGGSSGGSRGNSGAGSGSSDSSGSGSSNPGAGPGVAGVQDSGSNGILPEATVNLPAGGGSTIPAVVGPSGGIILPNSQTIAPGQDATYRGIPISVPTAQGGALPSAVIVGSGSSASTVPIGGLSLGSSTPPPVNIGGQPVPISYVPSGSGIILPNGVTLSPGSVATYNGQSVSLAPSGSALVVGGSTVPLAAPAPTGAASAGTVSIGGQTVAYSKAPSGSGIVLGNGETIQPGAAPQTINGVPVSLASGGSALAVGSTTIPIGSSPAQQTVNVGGSALPISYAPGSAGIILPNGQTLAPGSSIEINGVPVSLLPSENGLQVGSSSIALSGPSGSGSDASQSITVGSQVIPLSFASNGVGIILPNGQILSAGRSTNINGVPISLASGENFIVDGTSTISITAPAAEQSITLGSQTVPISYAPNGQGIILPNGQTLHPGQVTTISGTTVSLAPGETAVVVNGQTETLHPGAFTTGVGSYIASGLGFSEPSASPGSSTIPGGAPGSTAQAKSGAESSLMTNCSLWILVSVLVLLVLP